jgi:hypothetical protein
LSLTTSFAKFQNKSYGRVVASMVVVEYWGKKEEGKAVQSRLSLIEKREVI